MPVETPPTWIQGIAHPGTNLRNLTAALAGAPAAAVAGAAQITTAGGGHGVVGAGDLAVSQNGTPNMSVNVAAGRALIRGTETASLQQGCYGFFNDGAVNLTVAASDPTNPRRDLVVAQVRDTNYTGVTNDARLTVITGTAAAVPVDPTIPPNCLVLARISVAAGSTTVLNAAITDLRTRASSLGGIQVCTSTTRPTGASLYAGLKIFEADTLYEQTWTGSAWIITAVLGAWPSWTPTVQQGVGVTVAVVHATWSRSGRDVKGSFRLSVTGTGTAGQAVGVSLPVNAARTLGSIGAGGIFDTSAGLQYSGTCELNSSASQFVFSAHGLGVSPTPLGSAGFTAALAAGDIVAGSFAYEAAS